MWTHVWNMHAHWYLRKYENSIFALESIEYNIISCSHEREGTEERKIKSSKYQYTTSWMKYICTWVPIWNSWPWIWAEWILRGYAFLCMWINHENQDMISLSHSFDASKTDNLTYNDINPVSKYYTECLWCSFCLSW